MEYLFDQWESIKDKLRNKYVLFFFDYDGTLTPIAQTPKQAIISAKAKELLKKLSRKRNFKLIIISGRSLQDIKNLIGIKNIFYIGNHGLEIEGPKIKFKSKISLGSKSAMREICQDLINNLSKYKGFLIEDKGLTVSVHYRLVSVQDIQEFISKFHEITRPFLLRNKIRISEGKKVYEIRPPVAWDKGKTVLWFLARYKFLVGEDKILPVYFGDDTTDEDGFKVLKNIGLTIYVGEQKFSNADYYVENPQKVLKFIEKVLELE